MRRTIAAAVGRMSGRPVTAVAACFAAFIFGCAAGAVFSGMIPADGGLSEYFARFFELYASGESGGASPASVLFNTYVYHLVVFACGFSVIGAVLIPAAAAVRGFALSFSVAALIRLYSGRGVAVALAAFGATAIVSVPCFLVVSVLSFEASRRLFSAAFSHGCGSAPPYPGRYLCACLMCFAVLAVPALCEMFILPGLLRAAILRM